MWKIDKDYLLENQEGFVGEHGADDSKFKSIDVKSANYDESKEDTLIHPFRCYDDDGVLYYEGLSSNDSSFGPLSNFAGPNDGCTHIKYKNPTNGEWETL